MANATYYYTEFVPAHFEGDKFIAKHYKKRSLRVEIIEEGLKRTKIKFCAFHADGRPPGTVSTVTTEKVVSDAWVKDTRDTIDKSLGREIRKPYKDD